MRMIFLNLPVADLAVSKPFFSALGFQFNPQFSDEACACMVVEENIFVMLQTRERFADFVNGEIADATRTTELLTCLSATCREEVDRTLAKALASGGKRWKPNIDVEGMYGCSFQDPDGHVWELMYMDQSAMAPAEAKAAEPA